MSFQRILIIGPCGAGKSTLARRLAPLLDIPLIHLDREYWRAGWDPTPVDEWRTRVAELAARPRWLMDGNFCGSYPVRFAAADAVILLDLPRRVYFPRVLRRSLLGHGRTRLDMAPGCAERLDPEFIRYVWAFDRNRRPRVLAAVEAAEATKAVYRLRTRRAVRAFIEATRRRGALPRPDRNRDRG